MKNILILLALLGLMLAAYFLFVKDSGGTSFDKSAIDFALKDTSAVKRIEMEKVVKGESREKLKLEKRPDGVWMINDRFVAQRAKVKRLLETMGNLAVKQNLSARGRDNALQFIKNNYTEVGVYGKKGLIKSYYIGPTNKEQTGNMMLLKGQETPFIMSKAGLQEGYVSIYYSTQINDWRENLLFDLVEGELNRVSVDYLWGPGSFRLHRSGPEGIWQLGEGLPADQQKIGQYLKGFRGKVYAESFAVQKYPHLLDSLKRRSPDIRFSYEDLKGESDTLMVFVRPENPNSYWGWISGREELLTIQKFVIDQYLPPVDYFIGAQM